jgi:DeoR/GlpR family transcriptional regulator of sugar metabolism
MNVKKDEPRTLTVLKMVRDLGKEKLTMGQMVQRYAVTERTVYRYLKYLEEADYCVDKDFYNRFFIHQ